MYEKEEIKSINLPSEIWQLIMTFVTPQDRCTLELVCHAWQELASSDLTWNMATTRTKEEYRIYSFQYTILTLPSYQLQSGIVLRNYYKIVEEEARNFFNDETKIKHAYWPEDLGVSLMDGSSQNKIFAADEQHFLETLPQARQEEANKNRNNRMMSKNEFIIKYKQVGNHIHISALKHYLAKEYTILSKPIIFERTKIKNFPSTKPEDDLKDKNVNTAPATPAVTSNFFQTQYLAPDNQTRHYAETNSEGEETFCGIM